MDVTDNIRSTILKTRLKDAIIFGLILVIAILWLSSRNQITGEGYGYIIAILMAVSFVVITPFLMKRAEESPNPDVLIDEAGDYYDAKEGSGAYNRSPESFQKHH